METKIKELSEKSKPLKEVYHSSEKTDEREEWLSWWYS
jgi:hypothetical protein